jgi:biotin carboxyl carrier protein
MKKNLKVIVNGKPFQVEIDERGGNETTVLVNGVSYEVRLETAEGSPQQPAAAPASGVPLPAVLPSKPVPIPPALSGALTAPMPGVILNVVVKPGDRVARGDMLCSLEAMKMKNAIRSPREAVISSVEVHDGQKVGYGDVLIKFAEAV